MLAWLYNEWAGALRMNLIDLEPMRPSWGQIWQGGEEEVFQRKLMPDPWMIISLDDFPELTGKPVLKVFMWDKATGCLTDQALLAFTDTAIAFLRQGINVIIHCFEGKSRSSYLDIAVHMRVMDIGYDQAFALVKSRRPIAQPNKGFEAQLRSMERILRQGNNSKGGLT